MPVSRKVKSAPSKVRKPASRSKSVKKQVNWSQLPTNVKIPISEKDFL